ncbi:hypothetical protein I4U23_014881 [Adineta vaga]|nr:hypothetical protein I4U23_014881 [Adineta vaga]
MGCSTSLSSRIETKYLFYSNEILLLKQSWNTIKAHDFQKFVQNVLIRTSNESRSFRQFCISKVEVDGNNYDYGQHDSCLRTDLSWQIAIPDCSTEVILIIEQFLKLIGNDNHVDIQISSFHVMNDSFSIEYETVLIMKQYVLDILHERFRITNYQLAAEHIHAWNKFLTFIIEYIQQRTHLIRASKETIMSIKM